MQNLKIGGIAALSLIVLIAILQNTESVETRLLFFTITMPRAALLFGTFTIGFVVGLYTAVKILHRKPAEEKSKVRESPPTNE